MQMTSQFEIKMALFQNIFQHFHHALKNCVMAMEFLAESGWVTRNQNILIYHHEHAYVFQKLIFSQFEQKMLKIFPIIQPQVKWFLQ